jgi:hypothetical protein
MRVVLMSAEQYERLWSVIASPRQTEREREPSPATIQLYIGEPSLVVREDRVLRFPDACRITLSRIAEFLREA